MITPAASAPQAPAQMPASSFDIQDPGVCDTRTHADEIRAAHGCVPSPEAAVAMGVTPASGGE